MAKFNLYQTLTVSLSEYEYPIIIGNNVLEDKKLLASFLTSNQVFIVTNKTIAPLYLAYLELAFQDRQCDVLILEDGEAFKNQQSLFAIYEHLINKKHHRDTTLIALGGGVIGDLTGFAAATYQRGVRFVQIPTTLLAQVDASIGGKTAINHSKAKNMIGSFYQPAAVLMDLNTLNSLPEREFQAGLAEVIKYALLVGGNFFDLVFSALQEGLAFNRSNKLSEIIKRCCEIKAEFVQIDEREQGQRALLNLGHTVGHALEAYTDYKYWLHGEAVAIGLYCAAFLSYRQGNLAEHELLLIDNMLDMANLPRRIPSNIDLEKLRVFMSQDKKIKNDNLRFILMNSIGNCYIENAVLEDNLRSSLQHAVEGD